MDINTWLTIVTIFIGVFTILPKEERILLQLKLHRIEYILFFILLFILIPYLILFPRIIARWPVLSRFTVTNGFDSADIAFAIFYILFFWIILRFLFIKPTGRVNNKIIEYFKNALNDLSFSQFFSLFTKYSSPNLQKKYWHLYKAIILQPEFLKGVIKHRPSFIYNLWELLDEDDFIMVFRPFLTDINSVYYEEIKANDGNDIVLSNSPFLNSVLVKNLIINRKNGLLSMISDFSKQQIRAEKGKPYSIYAQPHYYQHTRGEEGYDIPVFYHIRFIALMYTTAIMSKIDIHPHMYTLYQGMIDEMIANLEHGSGDIKGEYPTNYHWLISEMFSSANRWLELFGGEHIKPGTEYMPESDYTYFFIKSTYIDFIPSCLNFCLQSLYKGVDQKKINVEFVARMLYYYILSEYFTHNFKE